MDVGCPECVLAAEAVDSLDVDVFGLTVDCDSTPRLCTKYELDHLPEVLLFNGDLGVYEYGKPYIYQEGLEEFIEMYVGKLVEWIGMELTWIIDILYQRHML